MATTKTKSKVTVENVVANLPTLPLNTIRDLTLPERAAMKSMAKDKNSDIPKGIYPIDVTIRLCGIVNKGDDYNKTVPAKINCDAVVGLCLSKMSETTANAVAEQVIHAVENNIPLDEALEHSKKFVDALQARIKRSTKQECSGPTTFVGDCTVIV